MWILEVFQACLKKVRILSCSLPVLLLNRLLLLDHEVCEVLRNSTLLKKNKGKQFFLDYVYTYNMFKLRKGKRLELQPTSSSAATSTTSKPVRKLLLAHQRRHLGQSVKRPDWFAANQTWSAIAEMPVSPTAAMFEPNLAQDLGFGQSRICPLVYVIYKFVFSITFHVCKIPSIQSHLSPSASLVAPGLLDWAVSNKARKCSSPIRFTLLRETTVTITRPRKQCEFCNYLHDEPDQWGLSEWFNS